MMEPSFNQLSVNGSSPPTASPKSSVPAPRTTAVYGEFKITGIGCHSSQPIEGVVPHVCPSMSVPSALAGLPAERHGESAAMCTESAIRCGSAEIFPGPAGTGELHEYPNVPPE